MKTHFAALVTKMEHGGTCTLSWFLTTEATSEVVVLLCNYSDHELTGQSQKPHRGSLCRGALGAHASQQKCGVFFVFADVRVQNVQE